MDNQEDEFNHYVKINEEEFENLYFQYSEKMLRVGLKYSNDKHLSLEIIQEIFLSIWERRDTLVIQGNPENYLIRAVKLKMLSHFRDYNRRSQLLHKICANYHTQENTTENEVLFKETQKELRSIAHNQLSEKCNLVFQMHQQTQLDPIQIAHITQLSPATVNNYLSKASTILQKIIKKNI